MSTFDLTRVATAAVGALVLSTSFIGAAVVPATTASTSAAQPAYAQVQTGQRANG